MSFQTNYVPHELTPIYVGGALATLNLDGSILATAVLEDIVITDLETNEVLHKLEGDGEAVTCLQITPDGKYLGIISQSQQLRIFNLHEDKFIKNFKLSAPCFISCADATSTLFSFGLSDGNVIVFDIENGFITHSFKGHGSTISALNFHGESNSNDWKLFSGDTNGLIKVWDLIKRKTIATLNEHNNAIRGLDIGGDSNQFLISGGRDDVIMIWNTKTWKLSKTLSVKQQVESCGFINEEYIYTAGGEGQFKVWDFKNGELITETKQPVEELMIVGVLRTDSNSLFLNFSDQTLFEIDLSVIERDFPIEILKTIAGNHGTIADMKFVGPNKSLLALATNSPSLRIIDPLKSLEVEIYEGHSDLLNSLDSSNDGLWIATASKDHDAILWKFDENTSKFKKVVIFKGHSSSIGAISLPKSTDSKPTFLITGSNDLTIKKWKIPVKSISDDLEEPIIVKTSEYTRRAHEKDINALDISPNDEFFATASYDKTAKIWDLETGEILGVLKGHKRGLWDVKFCEFNKEIMTASGDKTLKLWSLQDFQCLKTFEGHTNSVQRVEFLNKFEKGISSGADGLIKIWDLSTGECIKTLDMHANRIWALLIKNGGDEFISADADGVFQFWEDKTEELNLEEENKQKEKIEQEQNLMNFINSGDWTNAFLLALKLDHPMRLYNVLKSCISSIDKDDKESVLGPELDSLIPTLNDEQILLLFKRIRSWNVNSKFFLVSQRLIKIILKSFKVSKLIEIPGIMTFVDSLIPYNERHYQRIDDLIEQSFILDYSLEEMNKIL